MDGVFEHDAYVGVLDVAACIKSLLTVEEILTCAFRNEYEGVLAFYEAFLDLVDNAVFAVEVKFQFGNQCKVDVTGGKCCIGNYETCVPTHQPYERDAVVCALSLVVGRSPARMPSQIRKTCR